MTPTPDVLIAGGGIAGLTTALAAAARGLSVMLLDTARTGSASRTSAGMLAPSLEGLSPTVRDAALAARDEYPRYIAALCTRSGIAVALNQKGILELADSPEHLERLTQRAGPNARCLDAPALAALEPAFTGLAGAVLHPGDGAVDNVSLMLALEISVTLDAGITRINDSAARLDLDGRNPVVRTQSGAALDARRVVLAAGAWMNGITGLPSPFPVSPVRGQLLTLDRRPITHVTYGGGGYLVPRGDKLLIGATTEDVGFDIGTSSSGLAELRAIAHRALPSLAAANVAEHWSGLRPMSPDGIPVIGPDPADPRVIYAGGFSRNGILFAPWAALQLAALLAGESPDMAIDSFSIARFRENK